MPYMIAVSLEMSDEPNFCRLLRNYFMHGDLSDNIIKKKLDCYVRNNDGVKLLDNYFIEIESKDFLF